MVVFGWLPLILVKFWADFNKKPILSIIIVAFSLLLIIMGFVGINSVRAEYDSKLNDERRRLEEEKKRYIRSISDLEQYVYKHQAAEREQLKNK
jgi:hypothetical protein